MSTREVLLRMKHVMCERVSGAISHGGYVGAYAGGARQDLQIRHESPSGVRPLPLWARSLRRQVCGFDCRHECASRWARRTGRGVGARRLLAMPEAAPNRQKRNFPRLQLLIARSVMKNHEKMSKNHVTHCDLETLRMTEHRASQGVRAHRLDGCL